MSKRLRQTTARTQARQGPLGSEYKTRKRDRKRDQILDAAAAVFAEKGFHNATLKDIADRVDLLPASLYHYVESKEDALLAVCERGGQAFLDSIRRLLRRPAPVADLLAEAIVQHMIANRRELVYSFAFRRWDLPPQLLPHLTEMSREYLTHWEELIGRGVATGELAADTDPKIAALGLMAMCNGAIDWYEKRTETEIRHTAERFAMLVLDGLKPRRGKPGRERAPATGGDDG